MVAVGRKKVLEQRQVSLTGRVWSPSAHAISDLHTSSDLSPSHVGTHKISIRLRYTEYDHDDVDVRRYVLRTT